MQTVFVHPELCIGCRQCEIACAAEHSQSKDEALAFLECPVPRARIHVEPGPLPSTALPNRCRHCDPAPCLQVCPAGAIAREVTYGLVLIDDARCIGCAMCAVVCPFDVITFYPLAEGPSPDTAVAVKCDGCIDRQRASREPACVDSCKVQALVFGELNDLLRSGRLRQTAIVLGGAKPPAADQAAHALDGWRAWNSELLAVAVAAERIPAGGAR